MNEVEVKVGGVECLERLFKAFGGTVVVCVPADRKEKAQRELKEP